MAEQPRQTTDPTPAWLADVLGDHPKAAEVLAAIPVRQIADAIRESCATVLAQRGIRDGAHDLAREIANNSAQSVLFALTLGPDDAAEAA